MTSDEYKTFHSWFENGFIYERDARDKPQIIARVIKANEGDHYFVYEPRRYPARLYGWSAGSIYTKESLIERFTFIGNLQEMIK